MDPEVLAGFPDAVGQHHDDHAQEAGDESEGVDVSLLLRGVFSETHGDSVRRLVQAPERVTRRRLPKTGKRSVRANSTWR